MSRAADYVVAAGGLVACAEAVVFAVMLVHQGVWELRNLRALADLSVSGALTTIFAGIAVALLGLFLALLGLSLVT